MASVKYWVCEFITDTPMDKCRHCKSDAVYYIGRIDQQFTGHRLCRRHLDLYDCVFDGYHESSKSYGLQIVFYTLEGTNQRDRPILTKI